MSGEEGSSYMIPVVILMSVILAVTIVFIFLSVGGFNLVSGSSTFANICCCLSMLLLIWATKESDYGGWFAGIIVVCMACSMSSWIGAYVSGVRSITPTTPASTSPSTPTQ